ncbi:LbetaH domain-containing protein [Cyclobacterium xiamenense]|uniref:hypothetical protein n=1 Tax=Cyclobacterium xiamenense TaxID=1297121 RepID=UPI0012B9CE01|nr:hypothetical protein [Cyclobacterium xiamenense]
MGYIEINFTLLPGLKPGNNGISGAGSVLRGNIDDYRMLTENLAKAVGVLEFFLKNNES